MVGVLLTIGLWSRCVRKPAGRTQVTGNKQQRLQDQGIASARCRRSRREGLSAIAGFGDADRYRLVTMTVTFLPDKICLLTIASATVKRVMAFCSALIAAPASNQDPQSRYYLLDRGWVAAPHPRQAARRLIHRLQTGYSSVVGICRYRAIPARRQTMAVRD